MAQYFSFISGNGVDCHSSQRAYYATRDLVQNGFTARTNSGGMLSHSALAGA